MRDSNSFRDSKDVQKAVNVWAFLLDYVSDCFKTQEICEEAVSKELFMLK